DARGYLLLQERLDEIEVGMLVSELKRADYELYAGRQEREDDQTSLLKFDAELARMERAAEEVGERLAQTESEMDAVRLSQQNALSLVERTESQLTLMAERGQTAQKSKAQLTAELADIAGRMTRLTADIE